MLKGKDRESQVVYSRRLNWFLAEQDDFVERMVKEIIRKRPKEKQKLIIRIHASGDFYSEEYLEKWMLPIYFVTRETDCELKDCEEKSCAECLDCYKFPMKTVTTRLR